MPELERPLPGKLQRAFQRDHIPQSGHARALCVTLVCVLQERKLLCPPSQATARLSYGGGGGGDGGQRRLLMTDVISRSGSRFVCSLGCYSARQWQLQRQMRAREQANETHQ